MPSRTEATRAKGALCATGRLTPLRLFSTLPVCSPKSGSVSEMAIFRQLDVLAAGTFRRWFASQRFVSDVTFSWLSFARVFLPTNGGYRNEDGN
jgi:hypothetical protein